MQRDRLAERLCSPSLAAVRARTDESLTFLTTAGNLSPTQAQIELALPAGNTAAAAFRVDLGSIDPAQVQLQHRVTGNVHGRAGGGFEIVIEGPIREGFERIR